MAQAKVTKPMQTAVFRHMHNLQKQNTLNFFFSAILQQQKKIMKVY